MLDIADIQKIESQKRAIRKECYTKIYEMCEKKIKQYVNMGQKQIFFTVPGFVMGYPAVDRHAAAKWLARQFDRSGFKTSVVNDDVYVSWSHAGRRRRSAEETTPDDDIEYPSFVNLKKAADKYRHLVKK